MSLSATVEQQAFQSVKRVCYAGLDSVTLRAEIARRVERIVFSWFGCPRIASGRPALHPNLSGAGRPPQKWGYTTRAAGDNFAA